jgi:predicted nuclease of predicted toxin-antitoxin system
MTRRRRRVTLYLDEHIAPETKKILADADWRVIRIQESPYRGRDERDFIGELRSQSAIFVTSDIEFVDEVVREGIKHGGIWLINPALERDERLMLAALNAGLFAGTPPRDPRDIVSYLAYDGLHLMNGERDVLAYSFDEIRQDLDILHPDG